MLPINCKYSFVTVSDTIYSVMNCTYWNFIINTLHTCFKLIIIFEFMFLELFLIIPHTFSIGLMSGEWGGPVSISISQLLYHFKVSTDTCLASLSIYRTNLFSKISLIFGRISEAHLIFFLNPCCLWRKPMGILFYVKLHRIHLFFGFKIFFVLHETPHLEIPIFHYMDSLYKNEIHQYTHILHYQQYKGNIC